MKPTSKPADTRYRVLRGGGWLNDGPSWVRAASPISGVPAYRYIFRGFRTRLSVREPRV